MSAKGDGAKEREEEVHTKLRSSKKEEEEGNNPEAMPDYYRGILVGFMFGLGIMSGLRSTVPTASVSPAGP
jgi:hypothetical protein